MKIFNLSLFRGILYYIYIKHLGRYFRELAHVFVGAGEFEIRRTGQLAGNSGRISMLQI